MPETRSDWHLCGTFQIVILSNLMKLAFSHFAGELKKIKAKLVPCLYEY